MFLALASVNIDFLAGFVGDEMRYRSAAWEIFSGGPATNLEHPLLAKTVQGFFAAACVGLNLDPVVGMRFASVLAGAGVLIATHAIAARFVSSGAAILSTILLMSSSVFWVHARLISPEMISLFFLVLALYYFLADRLSNQAGAIGLAGAFFGLSLSAKWIGIWLVPWAILRMAWARDFRRAALFLGALVLFYGIGNGAYLLNHPASDAPRWQAWALGYHQTHAEISKYNGSPAWTWFAVPQHLYYARLMPDAASAETVFGTINPIVFLLVVPALWAAVRSRQCRAGLWLMEAAICLYLPWLFVSRPTYFFYVLTVLPVLAILEGMLLMSIWEKSKLPVLGTVACALIVFAIFYPAATGLRISNGYEKALARFNFYSRPVFDSMFCQKCNLYFGSEGK